jgi:hypothetical protein
LADHVIRRGGSKESADTQRLAKENFERNTPDWVRDGRYIGTKDGDTKETMVTFDGGTAITLQHGLKRKPKGWMIHKATGSPYSINEVKSDDQEIRLINNYGGAGTLVCQVWIW